MKKYYIYHIPGIKIGVSSEPYRRISDQGYTEFEILEEHTDIYLVSDREVELQIQYFGKRDSMILYWQSIERRLKYHTKACYEGGKKSGKFVGKLRRKLTFEQANEIRKLYANGNITYRRIGKMYGLQHTAIINIVKYKSYKEL